MARGPRTLRGVGTAVVALFTASVIVLLAGPAADGSPGMVARVGDQTVRVATLRPTVADALRAASVAPHDGALVAAVTKKVLDPHAAPASIFMDGRRATPDTPLRPAAIIGVADGLDREEPTEIKHVPLPAPPLLPMVEEVVWYPGRNGLEEAVVGAVSGEVLSRRTVADAVPPRREEGPFVALTFDDGPDPRWTPSVLQILAEEGVKATFCVVGDLARSHTELTRALVAQGHTLCNHTMGHPHRLDLWSPPDVAAQIEGASDLLKQITGHAPVVYRAPGGRLSQPAIEAAQRRGMRVLGWSVDPKDFEGPPAPLLLSRVVAALRPGAVVLLHDGGGGRGTTVEMLRPLIHHIKAQGWKFATPLGPQ